SPCSRTGRPAQAARRSSWRGRGAAMPRPASRRSSPLPDVDEMPLDGSGRGHLRRDEMRTAPAPLATLEVAVRRRGAALAGLKDVGVYAQAHRAARHAPVEAGVAEDAIQALGLGLFLDL